MINLDQFTGTEHYYKYTFGTKLTDGVKYLATTAGCYWLLDIIVSYQPQLKNQGFQVWKLSRNADNSYPTEGAWVVTCEDGNGNALIKQYIEYSDFPMNTAEVWFIDGVMLLPSEY